MHTPKGMNADFAAQMTKREKFTIDIFFDNFLEKAQGLPKDDPMYRFMEERRKAYEELLADHSSVELVTLENGVEVLP